jgi:hypothetical protein
VLVDVSTAAAPFNIIITETQHEGKLPLLQLLEIRKEQQEPRATRLKMR